VLRASVKDSPLNLTYQGEADFALPTVPYLWFVAADIVNNCNLRCPFCLVDYSAVTKTELMTEETFLSLIRLAPTVRDGHFYLSCLNEPTLHPHLNRFLGLVPPEARRKMFFTTNLARPLKEADFEAWAASGLHHINISLDTLDAARFGVLRRFGRLDVFMRNLEALSAAFRRTPHAPKLRYITMAFKSNFDEIATIVRRSREEWIASANEIRYTFNVSHITDEFRAREYLTREDWPRLTQLLQQTGYPVEISYPPEENYEKIEPAQNYYDQPGGKAERILITKPMGLRVRPDGTVLVNGAEDGFRVNINSLDNPARFFRALLRQATPRFDGFVGLP
jgi:MoaA/NifB/PqqE/SkfB family radical SAM enzyme